MIRWTTIGLLAAALLAAVLIDRVDRDPNVAAVATVLERPTPAMRSPAPLTQSWFCPMAAADETTTGEIVVANTGSEPAQAVLDVLTTDGAGPGLRVDLEPGGQRSVALADLGVAAAAAVSVEIIGGEGSVAHHVTTEAGTTGGPCATETSSSWFFAGGSTTRDTRQRIAVMNPLAVDVVFDVVLRTPARTRRPGGLESAVVPARSVTIIDLGEFVSRESLVAVELETIAGGQVVTERLVELDGSLGPTGIAVEAGVVAPALAWASPAGRLHAEGDHVVSFLNPGPTAAQIDVQLVPGDPADRDRYGLVPIELTIPAESVTSIDLAATADRIGVPQPYEIGVEATSVNGVPFVMQRRQNAPVVDVTALDEEGAPAADDAADTSDADEIVVPALEVPVEPQPTARSGLAIGHGSAVTATRWVTASVDLLPDSGTAVIVTGVEGALVEVRPLVGGALGAPVRGALDAGGRAVIVIPPIAPRAGLVLTADRPVVAEVSIVGPDRHETVPLVPVVEESTG